MHSVPDLRIELVPSRFLPWVVSIAHGMAFAAVMLSGLPPWASGAMLVLIGCSLAWNRKSWQQNAENSALILRGDGTAVKVSLGGTAVVAEIVATAVWPWLVVLRGRRVGDDAIPGRHESILLPADAIAHRDDFRRVRRWVLWVAANGPA